MGYTALLLIFVNSPDAVPKQERMCMVSWTSSLVGFRKMAASSAYRLSLSLAEDRVNGVRSPSLVANSNNLCSGSIARMNNIGDKGSPYRNPVLCLNHLPLPPLSRTEVDAVERSIVTQALHLGPNPIRDKVSIR